MSQMRLPGRTFAIGGVNYTLLPGYGTVPRDCITGVARDPKEIGRAHV